jgi:septal ring factor EnvC (AmiA/AmiB activator)
MMPEWLDKHWIEAFIAVVSGVLMPAAVFWGQKYFASRSVVHHVSEALKGYMEEHEKVHEAHEVEHRETEKRLKDLESHYTRIDERLRHLPSRADIDSLGRQIADLTSLVRKVEADVKGVGGSIQSLETRVNMLYRNELEG